MSSNSCVTYSPPRRGAIMYVKFVVLPLAWCDSLVRGFPAQVLSASFDYGSKLGGQLPLSGSRNHGWSCRFVGSSSEDTSCREADVCYICRVSKPPTLTWRGSLESRVPQLQGHPRHLTVVQNYEARHQ
ncbi:hypothetical protein TNCV_3744052 [Trichonephila clavipes]|nr:hypothetical protein TNCV_3744052 [Trichonephila clavipes]